PQPTISPCTTLFRSSAYKAGKLVGDQGSLPAGERPTGNRRRFAAAVQGAAATSPAHTLCPPSSRPGQKCKVPVGRARSYLTRDRHAGATAAVDGKRAAGGCVPRWYRYSRTSALFQLRSVER